MIYDNEIKILDNLECCFEGHECCIYVSLAYDESLDLYPYHLYVELFSDFIKEDWYESKEDVIETLKEIDDRFDAYIFEGSDALEKIEAFEEPEVEEEE